MRDPENIMFVETAANLLKRYTPESLCSVPNGTSVSTVAPGVSGSYIEGLGRNTVAVTTTRDHRLLQPVNRPPVQGQEPRRPGRVRRGLRDVFCVMQGRAEEDAARVHRPRAGRRCDRPRTIAR